MNFRKVNNLTGWAVFLIASAVYILTMEATGSLWDCGEFVASAFKLQIPHPPGAPLFVLMGRFFIILFGDNGAGAARAVNFMSAVASGFTILFLFWTITHFAGNRNPHGDDPATNVQHHGCWYCSAYSSFFGFILAAVGRRGICASYLYRHSFILKWEHEGIRRKQGIAESKADLLVVSFFPHGSFWSALAQSSYLRLL